MADLFDIVSQQTVEEYLPGGKVRERREVWAVAKPSGIAFPFRVVPADYSAQHVNLIAHDIAEYLNKLANVPGVVAVTVEQGVTGSNQIDTTVLVTVESSSGDGTNDVRLSWGEMFGLNGYPKLTKAIAQLDAVEGL
jgi:hypothetical protein